MVSEKTKAHIFYDNIKEKSKGWKWKGKLSFHLFFIAFFAFSGFFGEYIKTTWIYPYQGLGVILQFSIFIQFILYADLKKTITFHSVMFSEKKESPKGIFDYFENLKYWIKSKICDTDSQKVNNNSIQFVFYLYSFLTLLITLIALDKVFVYFNNPSLIHLLKMII